MVKSVAGYIFEQPVFADKKSFSSAKEINAFFARLPEKVLRLWPLNMEDVGLRTKYLSAKVFPETWKEEAYFTVQAEISDGSHHALLEQKFQFGADNNLIIDICSLKSSDSEAYPQKMRLARRLSVRNFKFLAAYDKERHPAKPSFISIYASSGKIKQNVLTCGGYVWANNGFDFKNEKELTSARAAFKNYLKKYKLNISDNSLKLFKKPCHFAAYGCGVLVNVNGKLYHMGKAFLMQYSWYGIQKTSSKSSVERQYADAYYSESLPALRRQRAIGKLSKRYRSFLRNTYKKNLLNRVAHRFKLLKKLFSFKMKADKER